MVLQSLHWLTAFLPFLPLFPLKGLDVSPEDYNELYDTLKTWIDDKTKMAKNRDFPNTVDELKKEIARVDKLKAKEVPAKKRDIASLSEIHDKLEGHKKKRSSAEGVPADKDLQQLKTASLLHLEHTFYTPSYLSLFPPSPSSSLPPFLPPPPPPPLSPLLMHTGLGFDG